MQTSTHGGCSQCWHGRGRNTSLLPTVPTGITRFQAIVGGTSLCARHACVQYSQPTHLLWSITIAHLCGLVPAVSEAVARCHIRRLTAAVIPAARALRKPRRPTVA